MRVLLDTNTLVDIGTQRNPFFQAAQQAYERIQADTDSEFFYATHSIATLFYLHAKFHGNKQALQFIALLAKEGSLAPQSENYLLKSISYTHNDFEDGMVIAAAVAVGANYILTRDLAGFSKSPIPAITPQDFLSV